MLRFFEFAGLAARKYLDAGLERKEALQRATHDLQQRAHELVSVSDKQTASVLALIGANAASCGLAWVESSFAAIHLSHRLAASFCCTSIPPECAEEIIPPFRCFVLHFPEGLLPLRCGFFLQTHGGMVLFHLAGPRLFQFGYEGKLSGYADEDMQLTRPAANIQEEEESALDEKHEMEKRLMVVAGRLLLGTCAEMMMPEQQEYVQRIKNRVPRRHSSVPRRWVFQLARDVKLDLREQVRDYLSGQKRGRLSLQRLVRGHLRRQAFGPRSALRKWVHIEPYWQGPDDAPIARRGHIL